MRMHCQRFCFNIKFLFIVSSLFYLQCGIGNVISTNDAPQSILNRPNPSLPTIKTTTSDPEFEYQENNNSERKNSSSSTPLTRQPVKLDRKSAIVNYDSEPSINEIQQLSKHEKNLTQVHLDKINHVALFFGPTVNITSVFPSKISRNLTYISRVWSYMTKTYGQFGPDPYLSLILSSHNKTRCTANKYFFSLRNESSIQYRNILDIYYNFNLPTDSTQKITDSSSSSTQSIKSNDKHADLWDCVTNLLSYFVEYSSKNRLHSPSRSIWQKGHKMDRVNNWMDIFTYDVYMNLNRTGDAQRIEEIYLKKFCNFPRNNTFWFKNWFLRIYTQFGGNKVLNQYFEVLQQNYEHYGNMYNDRLNFGEFIHFWCGAAQTDLKTLATDAFGWNSTLQKEFVDARKKYFNVTKLYVCKHCDEEITASDLEKRKIITTATIVGITVGILIIGVGIGASFLYRRKIKTLKKEMFNLSNAEVTAFFEGDANIKSDHVLALIQAMPFTTKYEIPREHFILWSDGELGSGEYATVFRGSIRRVDTNELVPVAIKTVNTDVDVKVFKTILSEVKIMAHLGKHENIVRLLGTCTNNIKNREIFIALEFCPKGDLFRFLKKNGHLFQDFYAVPEEVENFLMDEDELYLSDDESEFEKFSTLDLLKWSQDISNGMVYLTRKMVIHGDLAARNVLLTKNRVAKISDFGLSRQLLNCANYLKTSTLPIPWRWLAVETLKESKFSIESDVWAFGVTLWELFSLAANPYALCTWDNAFVDRLFNGERLQQPPCANERLYGLMQKCWMLDPNERPQFQDIYNTLGELISSLLRRKGGTVDDGVIEAGNEDYGVQYVSLNEYESEV